MSECMCESGRTEVDLKYRKLQAERSRIATALHGDFRSYQEYSQILQSQQKINNELRELGIMWEMLSLCKGVDCSTITPGGVEPEDLSFPEHLLGAFKQSFRETSANNRRRASNFTYIHGGAESCDEIPFRGLSDVSLECEPEYDESEPGSNQCSGKWVLVYGFQEKQLMLIETLFCQFGDITSYEESGTGNWVAICYAQAHDAERALARHLTAIDGFVIGVTDKVPAIRRVMAANVGPSAPSGRSAWPSPIRRLAAQRVETSSRCRPPSRVTGWEKLLEKFLSF